MIHFLSLLSLLVFLSFNCHTRKPHGTITNSETDNTNFKSARWPSSHSVGQFCRSFIYNLFPVFFSLYFLSKTQRNFSLVYVFFFSGELFAAPLLFHLSHRLTLTKTKEQKRMFFVCLRHWKFFTKETLIYFCLSTSRAWFCQIKFLVFPHVKVCWTKKNISQFFFN